MEMLVISPSEQGISVIIITVIFGFFATLTVTLRIWSRRLLGLRLALDDYLALVALVAFLPIVPIVILDVLYGGSGINEAEVIREHPAALAYGLKLNYIAQFFTVFASTAIKLSLLTLYWRVFPTRRIRISIYVLSFCCIGWFVAVTIINLVECRPISYFWDQSSDGSCIDTMTYFEYNSLVNTLIDILTICLPIHEIVRLQMSPSKKVAIISVFLLGSIVIVASATRFVTTVILSVEPLEDATKQYVVMGAASVVETFVAIIGACGITLGPAYKHLRYGPGKAHTWARQQGKSWSDGIKTIGRLTARESGRESFKMLERDEAESQTQIVATKPEAEGGGERMDAPLKGVVVEREPSIGSTASQAGPARHP